MPAVRPDQAIVDAAKKHLSDGGIEPRQRFASVRHLANKLVEAGFAGEGIALLRQAITEVGGHQTPLGAVQTRALVGRWAAAGHAVDDLAEALDRLSARHR